MIGREEELRQIEKLYQSHSFEFLVMYGRRRIGKTTILQEFSKTHNVIFFSAQEKNDTLNLTDFSKLLQNYYDNGFIAPFGDWEAALDYVDRKSADEKTVLIIDEFPFLAGPNPSIKSIFQHRIDHVWKNKNMLLILCGSSVSFMVNDIMGYESPLYGRITSKLEVGPFDYLESARFFPRYSNLEKAIAYGILGGVPRYLEAFHSDRTIRENIRDQILSGSSFLNDEPQILLRMETREPNIYNSIMEAIANGSNRVTEIADHIHEEKSKCSKYLLTLQNIRLVTKKVPCGEVETSRKAIYEIADNYYRFWYQNVFSNSSYINMIGIDLFANEIMEHINDYMGIVFESICRQYMIRQAKIRNLPFIPAQMDKWWGNNPHIKRQDDIDILALDKKGKKGIFCECKFRNRPMPMEEYDDLLMASKVFDHLEEKYFYFISKSGYTQSVIERAKKEGATLLTLDDLFM